jgi:hypothetical protein
MRHPNAFPRANNPREIRAMMHTAFDRYVHGEDMFPKVRMSNPDLAPRKTIDIAQALSREWEIIDEDQTYFTNMLILGTEYLRSLGGQKKGAQINAKVGRNAVNFALISVPGNGEQDTVCMGTQDRPSFVASLQESPLKLVDGRRLVYVGGDLQPDPIPEAIVERTSGLSSIFLAGSPDPHYELNRLLGQQRQAA